MKVLKYGTGQEIPKGAKYLTTLVEEFEDLILGTEEKIKRRLVWHYYAVSGDDEK